MSLYKNTTLYFMTGTGNSYRISTWLGNASQHAGSDTRVLSVENAKPDAEIIDSDDSLVGLVFPTHGFTAPWHVIKFAFGLPRRTRTHAFCVTARAGLKFGNFFPPGISGSAPFIIAIIMMLKGYSLRGTMSVDMPSNWYSLHPIQGKDNLEALIARALPGVEAFINKIFNNKKVLFTVNNLYEIIWGILLSFISLAYLILGRFFLAKLFFANKNCNACGLCAENCPVGAIKLWGKKTPKPFWRYNCESCMRCAAFCPKNAIEAGQSWAVILYFISAIPVAAHLLEWFSRHIPGTSGMTHILNVDILNLLYYYPAVFISYYIFSLALRIPAVNWIFTHTTLTHFWGRYREPGTKLGNISGENKDPV